MRKPKRLAALCAAFFMAVCLCSTVVYAEETPAGSASSAPESSAPAGADLPSGTGTVKEVYTDEDGRKFYTVQTPAGNTFYLIIDFTQQTENVYFLDAVAEKDLLALIEQAGGTVATVPESSAPDPNTGDTPVSEPSGEEAAGQTEGESNSGLFSMILIVVVVVIGGGAALYFKVIRKKRGNQSTHEEYEEDDISDEPETDLPPWDDEQEDDHV